MIRRSLEVLGRCTRGLAPSRAAPQLRNGFARSIVALRSATTNIPTNIGRISRHNGSDSMRSLSVPSTGSIPLHNCSGCGSPIQTTSSVTPGYLPETKLRRYIAELEAYENRDVTQVEAIDERHKFIAHDDGSAAAFAPASLDWSLNQSSALARKPKRLVCARCFSLTFGGKLTPVHVPDDDFKRHISHLKNKKAFVVCVVDVFDFPGSYYRGLEALIGQQPILLAVNKVDLLPCDIKKDQQHIQEWLGGLTEALKISQLKGIQLISAKTGYGVRALFETIHETCLKERLDAYMIGCTNVGKSSIFNNYLGSVHADKLTISSLPGTTLARICFGLTMQDKQPYLRHVDSASPAQSQEVKIFDSPGVMNPEHVFNYLTAEEIKAVLPTKRLVPVSFSLEPGKSLLLGGIARIDYEQGSHPVYFTVFASNLMQVHRTSIARANDFYATHAGTSLLQPPFGGVERMKTFPALEGQAFDVRGVGYRKVSTDIVLGGIGWVSIALGFQDSIRVRAYTPKGLGLFQRPALDPFGVNQHGAMLPNHQFELRRSRNKKQRVVDSFVD